MSDLREKIYRQVTDYAIEAEARTDIIMALFAPYEKLVEAAIDFTNNNHTVTHAVLVTALKPFEPKRPRQGVVYRNVGYSREYPAIELTPEVKAALVAAGIIEES